MEQCSPLGWLHCVEQKGKGELKKLLVQTTAELEAARDEISRKEEEIVHMRNVLVAVSKDHQFQELLIEKLCLQKQQMPTYAPSSEPLNHQLPTPSSPTLSYQKLLKTRIGKQRPLPEKGKLLQAVMEAGPTLETLLLAGQLPQWQQPPPQLDRIEIPPVTMRNSPIQPRLLTHQDSIARNICCMVNPNTTNNKKRGLDSLDGAGLSPSSCSKYQRVVQTS